MSREAFHQAMVFFVDAVSRVSLDQWEETALGVWNVRDLVGHTSRAMLTVEQYATVGADRQGIGTSEGIAERGRLAGVELGDDPEAAVRAIAARVAALVETLPADHPMHTPAGTRELVPYLRSRITELTIHTMDLAAALDLEVEPPPERLRETLYSLSDTALRLGVAGEVAFGLTGRKQLAEGFSVVP